MLPAPQVPPPPELLELDELDDELLLDPTLQSQTGKPEETSIWVQYLVPGKPDNVQESPTLLPSVQPEPLSIEQTVVIAPPLDDELLEDEELLELDEPPIALQFVPV